MSEHDVQADVNLTTEPQDHPLASPPHPTCKATETTGNVQGNNPAADIDPQHAQHATDPSLPSLEAMQAAKVLPAMLQLRTLLHHMSYKSYFTHALLVQQFAVLVEEHVCIQCAFNSLNKLIHHFTCMHGFYLRDMQTLQLPWHT